MNRRKLLSVVGTGCVAISGCLGDSDGGDGENGSNGNGDEDANGAEEGDEDEAEQYRDGYELVVLENRGSVHPNLVDCNYEDFPEEIRHEVEETIETGSYVSDERPELVQMDCYGYDMYVEYEGEYYQIAEEVATAESE